MILRIYPQWKEALLIVKPETVIRWHKLGFKLFWRWKSRIRKLGIEVSQATVRRYMVKGHGRPSQTWRSFLNNHVKDLASIDFFVVPSGANTPTISSYLIKRICAGSCVSMLMSTITPRERIYLWTRIAQSHARLKV